MLSHQMRFYAPYNTYNTHLPVVRQRPVYTDVNRNPIVNRPNYQNKEKYFFDKNWNMNKSPYVMRSNVGAVMPYSPYPPVTSQQSYFSSLEKNDYIDRTGNGTKPFFPFEQVSDYCTEMLNRDKHFWTEEETGLMLELYEENRDYFVDARTKKTKLWSVIASMINKKFSTKVNSEQCSQKYRNLKAELLKVSETQSPECEKKFGKHYLQMKRLIEAEERYYQLQENNWLANDNSMVSISESITSVKKISPSNNNNVKCHHTLVDNLHEEYKFGLSPETSIDTTSASKVERLITEEDSPVQLQTKRNCCTIQSEKDDHNELDKEDTPTSSHNEFTSTPPPPPEETNEIDVGCEQTENKENPVDEAVSSDIKVDSEDREVEKTSVNVVSDLSNKSLHTPEKHYNTDKSFTSELSEIFTDYMNTRKKMLETYEVKERENIKCMGRCVDIFYKVLKEKMKK